MPTSNGSAGRIRPVPAVARAAGILFGLGNGQEDATLTTLARQVGMHKSTAHGILATLAAYDLVERDPLTHRYRLGRALVTLGRAADRDEFEPLAQPHLARLCRLSGETVAFHLRAGDGSVIVASEESPQQLKVAAPAGHALPRFAGAVAKILHAFAGPAESRLPGRLLPAFTPQAITDPARYRVELDRVRREGVAYDDMEYLPGVRAVSAPVFRGRPPANAEAIGAISIIGVSARVRASDLRRFARALLAATRGLSEALRPRSTAASGRRRS